MSILRIARRVRREESGFAMIVAVVLLFVMATLVTLILTVGTHTSFSTARGRNWTQALHVAEAGVQQAIADLQANNGVFVSPLSISGSTDEGTFTVTVTRQLRRRFQIDASGAVAEGVGGLAATRKLRVTMAPPRSFKYALFSYTSVNTKGNDVIDGDIWANDNVIVEQGNTVEGGVTAALGYVRLKNGSEVKGDVWSGGFDASATPHEAIHLENNTTVDGSAKASTTTAPPTDCNATCQADYAVFLDGGAVIKGNLVACGEKGGSGTVQGTTTNHSCTSAPGTKPLPTFTYNKANYDSVTEYCGDVDCTTGSATAVSDFQAYIAANQSDFKGVFYVYQSAPVSQDTRINLTNVTVTGDTTIIANVPIFTNGMEDSAGGDRILTLVSTYKPPTGSSCDVNQDNSECSIHLKNNFQTSGDTAVIVYSPYGPVAIKNNQIQFGTIYADNIEIKNNQSLTWDERVERVVGFGPVTYEVQTWLECRPSGAC